MVNIVEYVCYFLGIMPIHPSVPYFPKFIYLPLLAINFERTECLPIYKCRAHSMVVLQWSGRESKHSNAYPWSRMMDVLFQFSTGGTSCDTGRQ